jgi:hypothetical protein
VSVENYYYYYKIEKSILRSQSGRFSVNIYIYILVQYS